MSDYTRPHSEPVTYSDADGNVIDYGNRWAHLGGSPPEDSYSVDDHPERFAPLHGVATALVEHLASHYDVDVEEGSHVTAQFQYPPPPEEIVRAVRLTPRAQVCAPLVVVLTTYPGVWLHAGVLFTDRFPSCGCNACDERWDHLADELEWQTFAIVGGGFTESVSAPQRARWSDDRGHGFAKDMGHTISYALRDAEGKQSISGQSDAEQIPGPVMEAARVTLNAVAAHSAEGHWLPWPRRLY